MVTRSLHDTSGPTLAGIVLNDPYLPHPTDGRDRLGVAGSACWPFAQEGPARNTLSLVVHEASVAGYAVPTTLLVSAGQVFYDAGCVVEVRLAGLVPGDPEATGRLEGMAWSTPTPPRLTTRPDGTMILDPSDVIRPHLSVLVVSDEATPHGLAVACVWNHRDHAPVSPPCKEVLQTLPHPTSRDGLLQRLPPTLLSPLLRDEHLTILSPAHYYAIRDILARNTFEQVEGIPWPAASIHTGPAHGQAQLRPVVIEAQPLMSPEETDRWAQRMWQQRAELTDLDADALDALSALWLSQARHVGDDGVADVDELLTMRGLQQKRSGEGHLGGYRPDQRTKMLQAVTHIQNLWLHITAMEVYTYTGIRPRRRRRTPTQEAIQSRVFVITDLLGQLRPDGFMDVEKFIFRPGKVFAHFLFGPGRQTALLSAHALHYDPIRQIWEKRLARYLSYQWRCKAHAGDVMQPFRVASLLDAIGESVNRRKPSLTRTRLEKALDTLLEDGVIAAWQYDRWDETLVSRRGWARHWLQATILIEPPDVIRETYQRIARHEVPVQRALPTGAGLSERIKRRRQELGLSQIQAAEQLAMRQGYFSRLERGKGTPSPALKKRLEQWLTGESDINVSPEHPPVASLEPQEV
ncbi:MAG: helix-turn-helix transcriptional regulator [Candidatus Tectomicrobia bacterium]